MSIDLSLGGPGGRGLVLLSRVTRAPVVTWQPVALLACLAVGWVPAGAGALTGPRAARHPEGQRGLARVAMGWGLLRAAREEA